MIDESKFDEAVELANAIIDFADCESEGVAAFSCLMAAATFLNEQGIGKGHAARVLRVLMDNEKANHETVKLN